MNPIKKLIGQTAVYGLSSIVGRFLNYLMVPLLVRIFSPDEYGVIVYWYALVSFIGILLTYGMETAFFRYSEIHTNKNTVYTTALGSLFVSSGMFILIAWLFATPIAESLGYGKHPEYVVFFAIILGADAFSAIPFARLRQENKGLRFATLKIINILVNISILLFYLMLCPWLYNHYPGFTSLFFNPEKLISYVFVANMLASLSTLVLLWPEISGTKIKVNLVLYKHMLIYAFPLMFAGLAGMVNETLDRIMLVKLINVPDWAHHEANKFVMSQTGIYGANFKLAVLMTLFIQTFRYAAEPFFFSYSKENNSKSVYADVMKYFILFGLVIFLGVSLYIDFAKIFISEAYYEGLSTVPVLLLANLLLGMVYNLSIWYKLTNQTKFGAYIAIFGAIVTIILNFILIPFFGYHGAAWTHLLCYGSMVVLSFYLGQKYYHVSYDLKNIGFYVLIALSLFFVSKLFTDFDLLLRTIIHTIFIFGFVLFVIKRENLFGVIKKIIHK